MQTCDRTQLSDASTAVAASARLGTASGGARDATRSDAVSGDGMGTGKATSTIAASPSETASSVFAASTGATSAVVAVAGLPATGAAATGNNPKSKRASASQPATAAVPHNAATTAGRRKPITASCPAPSEVPADAAVHRNRTVVAH